jgi:hypothetical protein
MKNKILSFNVISTIVIIILALIVFNVIQTKELRAARQELTGNELIIIGLSNELNSLKEENDNLKNKKIELENIITQMLEDAESTETEVEVEVESAPATEEMDAEEKDFLAKLLYCEAGGEGWECQVYTCSAILNLSDYSDRTIWDMGHDYNTFSVAYIVDDAVPSQTQYDVIDYVLDGGRIPEICFFRTKHYHNFGTPVCQVGAHYFSKP